VAIPGSDRLAGHAFDSPLLLKYVIVLQKTRSVEMKREMKRAARRQIMGCSPEEISYLLIITCGDEMALKGVCLVPITCGLYEESITFTTIAFLNPERSGL
jgi:hypothetical protein